ncbi:hypothetical protein [Pontibacillus yanchengensis]|uniref:Lipoprotein n=1 Tax=Pontibacillus yanchengensis Y32 TaxID=1385514 RepID=A0A0A2T842_9BACI|nr:hypothetical protein [Pontibacillus yanchengensis]KGP71957.1 hypothetical protein N782_14615 [Pontibacillus yanchengensis Y32]
MQIRKMIFILATLAFALIGCNQVEEGTFIQGNITNINDESGDMEIEIISWTTVSEQGSSTESYAFEEKPSSQTIRVSNPKNFDEGQKVKMKVLKNYDEEVWNLEELNIELEKVT